MSSNQYCCWGHAIAFLTCQKRAAAPRKPGELRRSLAIRLCDEFALAAMLKIQTSKGHIVVHSRWVLFLSEVWHKLRNGLLQGGFGASPLQYRHTICNVYKNMADVKLD